MADPYQKFRDLLKDQEYPMVYLYKFIIKDDPEKLVQIKQCFDESAEIEKRPSRNGNYLSVSIKEMAMSVDMIIGRYEQVAKIDGVINL